MANALKLEKNDLLKLKDSHYIILYDEPYGKGNIYIYWWWRKGDEFWTGFEDDEGEGYHIESNKLEIALWNVEAIRYYLSYPNKHEWTYDFPEKEHPRLFTAHGACRIIEVSNDKDEKHLAFFGTYMEGNRLGKYHFELNSDEEQRLFEFLLKRQAETAKKVLGLDG